MLPKQTEYNVGIYLRLSKDDERAGESISIENQRKILTKYVQEQGWNIYDIYIDDGISGTTFDRPGVQRMLEDAKNGNINLILCKDLSRFGRNYIQVGQYTDYIFPMYNIRFIALTDNIDTANSDSASMDMMPIINLFNEWHSASTSKKIKAVFETNAKAGKYLGSKVPYGYIRGEDENHLPVVNPETAPIVQRIFQMRVSGMSQRRIADTLNAEGITCPSDYYYNKKGKENIIDCRHLWGRSAVDHILKNRMYLGDLVQLKSTTVSHKNHKTIPKDESEWAIVPDTHEALITQEIWDRCRELDEERTTGKVTKQGDVKPLSALMYCADCGFRMKFSTTSKWRGQTTGNPHKIVEKYYKCGTYSLYGKEACSTHYISLRNIEALVLGDIRTMIEMVQIDEIDARKKFLARKQRNQSQYNNLNKDKLKAHKSRIAELDNLMQSVYEDKVQGNIPASVCGKLLEKYEAEQKALVSEVAQIETQLLTAKQDEKDVDQFITSLKKYQNAEILTREMCLELIDHITIDEFFKGKTERDIHIYYKFIDKGYSKQPD